MEFGTRYIVFAAGSSYFAGVNRKMFDTLDIDLKKYSRCYPTRKAAECIVRYLHSRGGYPEAKVEKVTANYLGRWDGTPDARILGEEYN